MVRQPILAVYFDFIISARYIYIKKYGREHWNTIWLIPTLTLIDAMQELTHIRSKSTNVLNTEVSTNLVRIQGFLNLLPNEALVFLVNNLWCLHFQQTRKVVQLASWQNCGGVNMSREYGLIFFNGLIKSYNLKKELIFLHNIEAGNYTRLIIPISYIYNSWRYLFSKWQILLQGYPVRNGLIMWYCHILVYSFNSKFKIPYYIYFQKSCSRDLTLMPKIGMGMS